MISAKMVVTCALLSFKVGLLSQGSSAQPRLLCLGKVDLLSQDYFAQPRFVSGLVINLVGSSRTSNCCRNSH